MPAVLRNEEVPVWREVATVFVANVILSILYFALWGPPYLIMSNPHFLATTLLGLAICMIIYHGVSFIELRWVSSTKRRVVFTLPGIILIIGTVIIWRTPLVLAVLGLAMAALLIFHVFYVRFSLTRSLYEIYLRALFPQFVFFMLWFGPFLSIVDIDAPGTYQVIGALFYSSPAYFFVRPFVNHLLQVRSPAAPEA